MKKRLVSLILSLLILALCSLTSFASTYKTNDRILSNEEITALYQDTVNNNRRHPVEIYDYRIHKINDYGGIEIAIGWTNTSGKEIKYITFTVTPYNRVDDPVACTVTGVSTIDLPVTGPFASSGDIDFMQRLQSEYVTLWSQEAAYWSYLYTDDGKIYWDEEQQHAYIVSQIYDGVFHYDEYKRFYLTPEDFMGGVFGGGAKLQTSKVLWYNSEISYFKIDNIHIDYMDGTSEDIVPANVILSPKELEHSRGYSKW